MKNFKDWLLQTRKGRVTLVILTILIVFRLALPIIIQIELNKSLADFSPIYTLHIDRVSLSFLRGAYRFEGLDGKLRKKTDVHFLHADLVDVSVAWREILKGRIVADIILDGLDFAVTPELIEEAKAAPEDTKNDSKTAAGKLFPVRVERVDLRNASFEFAEVAHLPEAQQWRIKGINGRVSNLTPSPDVPFALLVANGSLMEDSVVKVVGRANTQAKPLAWETQLELKGFDLVKANPWLLRVVPLDFKAGTVDIYTEIKSENEKLEGYIKPFFKKVIVIGRDPKFVNFKHFGIELLTAFFNIVIRDPSEKTVAAKIPFVDDKDGFQIEKGVAFQTLFENGFGGGISPGIEDKIHISQPKPKKEP